MDGGILEEKCNHKESDREKDGLLLLWASSQLGEDVGDSFTLPLIYLSIQLRYQLSGHSVNDSEPLLCGDSADFMTQHIQDDAVISPQIIYEYYIVCEREKCSHISQYEKFEV